MARSRSRIKSHSNGAEGKERGCRLPPRHSAETSLYKFTEWRSTAFLAHADFRALQNRDKSLPRWARTTVQLGVSRSTDLLSLARISRRPIGVETARRAQLRSSCCTPRLRFNPCCQRGAVSLSLAHTCEPLLYLSSLPLSLSHTFRALLQGNTSEGREGTRGSLARCVCACIVDVRRVSRYLRCEFQDGFKRPCVTYSRAAINSIFV